MCDLCGIEKDRQTKRKTDREETDRQGRTQTDREGDRQRKDRKTEGQANRERKGDISIYIYENIHTYI